MSSEEKKSIEVVLRLPVKVRLDVSYDAENEHVEIHSVERLMIQSGLCPRDIYEGASESEFEYIDEEAKKAFGVEGEE